MVIEQCTVPMATNYKSPFPDLITKMISDWMLTFSTSYELGLYKNWHSTHSDACNKCIGALSSHISCIVIQNTNEQKQNTNSKKRRSLMG